MSTTVAAAPAAASAAATAEKSGEPRVEVVSEKDLEDDDDDDDDVPDLEENAAAGAGGAPGEDGKKGPKQNKAEKKARKAMQKLGMKQIAGITRVAIKKAKNILFVISRPDVFKSPSSDTFVIFGEAKIEDINAAAQAAAAEQATSASQHAAAPAAKKDEAAAPAAAAPAATTAAAAAADDANEVVDETGLDPEEIQTVMAQASTTRAKAVKALKKHKNIVDAILELTP